MHCRFFANNTNPPLLFFHGFMGNGNDWETIAESFSSDYFCLALDLPGHGLSITSESEQAFNMENSANSVIKFLDQHNIKSCYLVGYSMGGRLALFLAIHFPTYFKKLIIESAQPGIADSEQRRQRQSHDLKIAQKLRSSDLTSFLEFWYSQPIFESLKKHPNFKHLVNSRLANDPDKLSKSLIEMGTGSQPNLWRLLYKITCPCLLIAGEYDLKYQKIFSKMHKEIFASKFVVLKNCGHNVHFENPDEFVNVVRKFLKN